METTAHVPAETVAKVKSSSPRIVERFFTQKGVNPLDSVGWKTVDAVIIGGSGTEKFRQNGVEVPDSWSEMTIGIVAEKYFRVVDGVKEHSAKQMFSRISKWISNTALLQGLLNNEEARILGDELLYMLCQGIYAFNSPVWFNVGTVDTPQCSACFIQSVDDTMDGIMDLAKREVMLFKGGSGTGGNLSTLRSSHEPLSRGGHASGPVSFMKGFDAFAGVTKSGGTTRRAAKMIVLNADHPDILEQRNGQPGFISCKADAEEQARALYETGKYTAEWNIPGNVYDRVGYQNANHSVRVTDEFMKSMSEEGPWSTKLKDGSNYKEYEAIEIWNAMAEAAHICGCPGVQFDTTTNEWHTCKESGRINASNPCSEYLFLDETACNLGSINLLKFTTLGTATFDTEAFKQCVQVAITAKELLVGLSQYPSPAITEMSHKFRTLGLGYTNLGALLTYWGLPYDSDEGRNTTAAITSLMGGEAYAQSARLAKKMGPFSEYKRNEKSMLGVIDKHLEAATDLIDGSALGMNTLTLGIAAAGADSWLAAFKLGSEHGFRNAQTTVLAPTGTISFLMGCATTGIEPMLGCVVYKKVVGGGLLIMPNHIVEPSLVNLGYSTEAVESMLEYVKEHGTLASSPDLRPEHKAIFAEALGPYAIRPEAHVDMMAAAQPFLSGGISKTVNMPSDATPQDIADIYLRAWRMGLKCIAVFRDGCKLSQPINTKLTENDKFQEKTELMWGDRKRIGDTRKAWNHKFAISGLKGYINTGAYEDGTPAELFLQVSKQGSFVGGIVDALAMSVSLGLQHGVPLKMYVDKFKDLKFEPSGFTGNEDIRIAKSLPDYVFRWLEQHYEKLEQRTAGGDVVTPAEVKNLMVTGMTAPDMSAAHGPPCASCGNLTKRSGSCYVCTACGDTTGCG